MRRGEAERGRGREGERMRRGEDEKGRGREGERQRRGEDEKGRGLTWTDMDAVDGVDTDGPLAPECGGRG